MTESTQPRRAAPTFAELFTPKFVTVLREGYDLAALRADTVAGLTVAMVALPLSMAIATASGTTPDKGLFAAIVGGFLISLLGGSRFQIGGPAGAFIVLVASSIERHGFEGFLLATLIAGLLMMLMGFLRLGTYIKYIPHPVSVGLSSGIGVLILASQGVDLLGVPLAGREPAALLPKLEAIRIALPTFNLAAIAVAACVLAIILGLRRWRPHWPGFLVAIVVGGAGAALLSRFGIEVATIGSKFGGIPGSLPTPQLPPMSLKTIAAVFPDAVAIAILGSIESLLSAVVADGMSGRRHRSNCELVAQGVANIGCALFGAMCATGTIARTATNVRSGARGPVAGMIHAAALLVMMLVAAPLAAYIPLAALAGVLAVVSWNMAEKAEFAAILRRSRGDGLVLLTTFLLTVFRDLTEGIAVGVVLGSIIFMHRMAELVQVQTDTRLLDEDRPDTDDGSDRSPSAGPGVPADTLVDRISGPFFFGAASEVTAVLDRMGQTPRVVILDLSAVPFVDGTAALALEGFVAKAHRSGTRVWLAGASVPVRRVLVDHGVDEEHVGWAADVAQALAAAQATGR